MYFRTRRRDGPFQFAVKVVSRSWSLACLPSPTVSHRPGVVLFRAAQLHPARRLKLAARLFAATPVRRVRGRVDQPQVAPVSSPPLIDYLIDLVWLSLVPFGQLQLPQNHLSFVLLTCTLGQPILREVRIAFGD